MEGDIFTFTINESGYNVDNNSTVICPALWIGFEK
jgi:hypothetical protein